MVRFPDDGKCLACGAYISFVCLRVEQTFYIPDGFVTRLLREEYLTLLVVPYAAVYTLSRTSLVQTSP